MASRIITSSLTLFTIATCAACSGPDEAFPDSSLSLYALVSTAPGVYLYPPLAPEPEFAGTFDASLLEHLSVVLEATDAEGTLHTLGTFSPTSQPALKLLEQHGMYFVNVPAATYFTEPSWSYAFRVLRDGEEIARSDMTPHVFTVLRWVPALTVGVKVRIEQLVRMEETCSGRAVTFTVPPGVTSVSVDMAGAQGGDAIPCGSTSSRTTGWGGRGARLQATLAVTPGQELQINVGCAGAPWGEGGWNGGGVSIAGPAGTNHVGAGGGGASDIRVSPFGIYQRLLVAAGGGGGGAWSTRSRDGGSGGWPNGASSFTPTGCSAAAGGGTQGGGGASATSVCSWAQRGGSGGFGSGGNGAGTTTGTAGCAGGGGGGGFFGGAGGNGDGWGNGGAVGGGGGSSYAGPAASNVIHTSAYASGHGFVSISY